MSKETDLGIQGIGIGSLLQIVFIVLKLCKVITWKWIWVLAPMWIEVIILSLAIIVVFIIDGIKEK